MALKDLIQVVATLRVCFIEKRGNKHQSNKTVCKGALQPKLSSWAYSFILGGFALFRMFNLSWQKNCTMDIGNHFKPVIYFQASDVAQERILLMSKCFWFWPIFWKLLYLELQKATINRSEPTTNPELDFYEIQNLST